MEVTLLNRKPIVIGTMALATVAVLSSSASAQVVGAAGADASPRHTCAKGCLNPIEAVTFASYLGSRAGVAAEFSMSIKNIGFADGRFYLNSEEDYRDRNCLTVEVLPALMQEIVGSTDLATVRSRWVGKRVVVVGVARQVRINFTAGGKPTDKYYYQVHIRILEKRQLTILPV